MNELVPAPATDPHSGRIQSPHERILGIYGAGHLGWLRQDIVNDATVKVTEAGRYHRSSKVTDGSFRKFFSRKVKVLVGPSRRFSNLDSALSRSLTPEAASGIREPNSALELQSHVPWVGGVCSRTERFSPWIHLIIMALKYSRAGTSIPLAPSASKLVPDR